MYKRFLNDNDYLSVITADNLAQMTRGNTDRFIQAEEAAEMSIVEHLSENYEIEQELNKGKYIAVYDRRISFPSGVHIYYEGKICEVIRSISGYKAPADITYWEEFFDVNAENQVIPNYSQLGTYHRDELVSYNGNLYKCLAENGFKFGNIRIPMVTGWLTAKYTTWQPKKYRQWNIVKFENAFYTLLSLENYDNNINPFDSNCWGAVADYSPEHNAYELSKYEYVVYGGKIFYPGMDVNSDIPEVGKNLSPHDPRSNNLKKHFVRLAAYELCKLIAPNNVSVVRIRDYEDSMKWLSDAARLKLNPQIPRRLAEDKKPVTDWQMATFQTDYDPYKNPWLT